MEKDLINKQHANLRSVVMKQEVGIIMQKAEFDEKSDYCMRKHLASIHLLLLVRIGDLEKQGVEMGYDQNRIDGVIFRFHLDFQSELNALLKEALSEGVKLGVIK